MARFSDKLKHAWNAFQGQNDQPTVLDQGYVASQKLMCCTQERIGRRFFIERRGHDTVPN